MKVYVTENSVYYVDEALMRYTRAAIDGHEQEVYSHRLTYGEWHPLKELPTIGATGLLHIMREDSTMGIFTSPVVDSYDMKH